MCRVGSAALSALYRAVLFTRMCVKKNTDKQVSIHSLALLDLHLLLLVLEVLAHLLGSLALPLDGHTIAAAGRVGMAQDKLIRLCAWAAGGNIWPAGEVQHVWAASALVRLTVCVARADSLAHLTNTRSVSQLCWLAAKATASAPSTAFKQLSASLRGVHCALTCCLGLLLLLLLARELLLQGQLPALAAEGGPASAAAGAWPQAA